VTPGVGPSLFDEEDGTLPDWAPSVQMVIKGDAKCFFGGGRLGLAQR